MSYVYITGATGFLGKSLIKLLNKRNVEYIAASRNKKFNSKNKLIIGKYEELDPKKNSTLLHLAESNDISAINKNGIAYYNKSVNLVKKLLSKPWSHVIYISSALVYGINSNIFHEPSEKLKPNDIYTKNKLKCENLVIKNGGTVLRITNTYGPEMSKVNLFSDILKQLDNNKIFVKSLNSNRDYLWIDDCVEAINSAIKFKPNKILNVASGKSLSVAEITNIILKITKQRKTIQELNKSKKINTLNLNIEKTKKILKWHPKVSVEKGINLMLKDKILCP